MAPCAKDFCESVKPVKVFAFPKAGLPTRGSYAPSYGGDDCIEKPEDPTIQTLTPREESPCTRETHEYEFGERPRPNWDDLAEKEGTEINQSVEKLTIASERKRDVDYELDAQVIMGVDTFHKASLPPKPPPDIGSL